MVVRLQRRKGDPRAKTPSRLGELLSVAEYSPAAPGRRKEAGCAKACPIISTVIASSGRAAGRARRARTGQKPVFGVLEGGSTDGAGVLLHQEGAAGRRSCDEVGKTLATEPARSSRKQRERACAGVRLARGIGQTSGESAIFRFRVFPNRSRREPLLRTTTT